MNDIVTAALWLLALAVGGSHLVAGVLVGAAILVRPNLAPLALVIAAIPFIQHRTREQQLRGLAAMAAGSLPGVLVLLWLNRALYGSVFGSGYGDASSLFAIAHINHEPVELLARALRDAEHGSAARRCSRRSSSPASSAAGSVLLLGFVAVVFAIYLLYSPFPEWWYLRFLIPALVVLLVLASAVGVHLLSKCQHGRRDSDRGRRPRHCRHARGRGSAGLRAAAPRRPLPRDGRTRARSSAGECRADHRLAERRHPLPCGSRGRVVGVARSGVARSRDHVAAIEGAAAVSSVRAARRARVPRAVSEPVRRRRPRLAAALRSEPPGAGSTIPPIARGSWRASRTRPKTSGRR